MVPVAGRPTGPIVWDLLEGVNQHRAWGEEIPYWRPEICPGCGRAGTLVGHGSRVRKKSGTRVRRLRCGRQKGRPGTCGQTCTVLPSFLYPRFWYGFDQIQPILLGRYAHTPPKSWRELGLSCAASDSTLMRWCAAFTGATQPWSEALLATFAQIRDEFALPRAFGDNHVKTTLALAGLVLDWRERAQTGERLEASKLLQRLWGWGSQHLKNPLFLPTTDTKGAGRAGYPKRGPPNL